LRRSSPVGAKVGTEIDTGAAADAQSRLEDLLVEFFGTEFIHRCSSLLVLHLYIRPVNRPDFASAIRSPD